MFKKEAEKYREKVIAEQDYPHSISLDWLRGAEFGYNKCKEEMQKNGLALQSDMDETIKQNIALKKMIEKMKCCMNCKYKDLDYSFSPICISRGWDNIRGIGNPFTFKCDEWEIN